MLAGESHRRRAPKIGGDAAGENGMGGEDQVRQCRSAAGGLWYLERPRTCGCLLCVVLRAVWSSALLGRTVHGVWVRGGRAKGRGVVAMWSHLEVGGEWWMRG